MKCRFCNKPLKNLKCYCGGLEKFNKIEENKLKRAKERDRLSRERRRKIQNEM